MALIKCPKCKGFNIEFMRTETIGDRDAKTKTTTILNLNPLKPFDVFNHTEKVVKKVALGTM